MTWCAPVFEEPEYKTTLLQTLPRRTELKRKSDTWVAFQALLRAASLFVFCSPTCKAWVALFRQGGDSSTAGEYQNLGRTSLGAGHVLPLTAAWGRLQQIPTAVLLNPFPKLCYCWMLRADVLRQDSNSIPLLPTIL